MFVGRAFISAPHGQLEAIYKPVEAAQRVALVLHPHPLYGGTMHNKVVARAANALETAGYATLRFNFRDVENSTAPPTTAPPASAPATGSEAPRLPVITAV